MVNLDPDEAVDIAVGDRIAQLVVVATADVEAEWSEDLPATERGTGGFGSSGP